MKCYLLQFPQFIIFFSFVLESDITYFLFCFFEEISFRVKYSFRKKFEKNSNLIYSWLHMARQQISSPRLDLVNVDLMKYLI